VLIPPLGNDEVHVWRVELDCGADAAAHFRETLSSDERERADRFRFEQDRIRYTVARGVTRRLLGHYSDTDAAELRFEYGAHGKPFLPGSSLRFNVSHSRGLGLIAVTRGREIGIDVEAIRNDLADEKIAERFFSPGEVTALLSLPSEERIPAFFRCWTRKEAFIKADGRGLTRGLDSFDVTLAPGEPAALLRTAPDTEEVRRWSMLALDPGPGYAGALCVQGTGWEVAVLGWEHSVVFSPRRHGDTENAPR
jgi:4'-phosphopantetheinyl transferase